ncbi:MAG: ROK family protein [Candidatus Eisenbacteria bacterium]|nr:ROK family protein [Candidatus Eisenbacteria bacterium]
MTTLGFDIGGTFVKVGRLSGDGMIEEESKFETSRSGPDALVDEIEKAASRFGSDLAIGVACAGIIRDGVVVTSPNLPGWTHVDLGQKLRAAVGRPVAVLNDANAFTVAEVQCGAAQGVDHVVGLAIGTGVGGGIVLGGKIWTGRHGYAGELGHVILDLGGPKCSCGNRGCLEALIGTSGILRRYCEERESRGMEPDEDVRPVDVYERAEQGDAAAVATWEHIGEWLGLGLASFTHILDPDLFLVGGGISAAGERLLAPARRALHGNTLLPESEVPEVRPAALGNSAGWIGAAVAARGAG